MMPVSRPTLMAAAPLLIALLIPALIPQSSTFLTRSGTDKYEAHQPLSAGQSVSYTFTYPHRTLNSLGIVLVPFKGQPQGQINLTIKDSQQTMIASSQIAATQIEDDTFEYFPFSPLTGLSGQSITLELSSTDNQPNVAARFDLSSDSLAIDLSRQTNLYGKFSDYLKQNSFSYQILALSFLIGALTALAYLIIGRPKFYKLALIIVLLAVAVLGWRLSLIKEVSGVSGGDTYNFLFIMQRIETNGQFYHPDQKRMPGFPLALLPSKIFTTDTIWAARVINQFIVALTILALALLIWQLALPPPVALLAALLFAFNSDILFIGFRPLAYPLLGLLVLLSLNALLWAGHNPRRLIIASLLFGLAAQTRQEGLLVGGVVLLVASLPWLKQKNWLNLAATLLPFAVIISPYFIANYAIFGDPFYSGYIDHPVTNIHRSLPELKEQAHHAWAVLGSTWWDTWRHQLILAPDQSVKITMAGLILLTFVLPIIKRNWPTTQLITSAIATPLIILIAVRLAVTWPGHESLWRTRLSTTILFLAAVGLVSLIQHAWRQSNHRLPVIIVLLTAAGLFGIATWVHPVAKTYFSFLPYLALASGLGLYTIVNNLFGPIKNAKFWLFNQWLGMSLVFTMLAIPLTAAALTLPSALDYHRLKFVTDHLLYQSTRYLADQPGQVATKDTGLAGRYYLGDRIIEFPDATTQPSVAELRLQNIRFIIWRSDQDLFTAFAEQPHNYPVRSAIQGLDRDDNLVEFKVIEIVPTN